MSTAVLWAVIPLVASGGLWLFRRQERLVTGLATGLCLILALLAWQLPIGVMIRLGPISWQVLTTLEVFGRRFALDASDRPFLILLYIFGAVWFFGAQVARARASFVPIGLAMIALVVAAQAVDPFLYAALILEMAILISLPLLASVGQRAGTGALRYLVFQTMAIPFILLAGWAAGQVELNPPGTRFVVMAILFMALGFSFWLAVFPFNTWVPLLTQQSPPYISGFILGLLPVGVLWMALGFLDGYAWLRDNTVIINGMRLTGMLMIFTAGLWVAFQSDLSRILGYAILMDNGYALLAIGLHSRLGLELFAVGLLPRLIAIALWALSLSVLRKNNVETTLEGLGGVLKRYPVACSALALAYFSLGGLPLLGSFPVRQSLMEAMAGQSWIIAGGAALGNLGFLLGAYRLLAALARGEDNDWSVGERWIEIILLLISMAVVLAIGLLPGVFLGGTLGLVQAFTHLR